MNATQAKKTFSILIAALGGEGGGVLADWLVHCARESGLPVQATSVPGVAQRTGATSYYIELQASGGNGAPAPVFALHPTAGAVDVVIASELVEAARMIERGYVAPGHTLLITSTHRIYTTAEKLSPSDSRYRDDAVLRAAHAMAGRCVAFNMEAIATASGTVISAVMFGALSGAGALPWGRDVCEAAVRGSGRSVEASLRGFDAAFAAAADSTVAILKDAPLVAGSAAAGSSAQPEPLTVVDNQPAAEPQWPDALKNVAEHGAARCRDYQNDAYAERYLNRLNRLSDAAPPTDERAAAALLEAARCLALWMCFEDVIRVADLKTRRSRFEQLYGEVAAGPGEIVHVFEYMKPQIDEIAAVLPQAWGARLEAFAARHPRIAHFGPALKVRSSSLSGFLTLRLLAAMQPMRPRSLRFSREQQAIDGWIDALADALPRSSAHARVLAELPSVLKGYGDTWLRGRAHYERLWDAFVARPSVERKAAEAFAAALADALSRVPDASAPPLAAPAASGVQPIRFMPRPKAPPSA